MKAHLVSLINAILLIVIGGWGYLGSENPSGTALIPVGFGVVLLLLNPGIKKENKVVAHLAVLFTFLILLGLFMPFKAQIGKGDGAGIARVGLMLLSTLWALVAFVQSFIAARKAKASTEE